MADDDIFLASGPGEPQSPPCGPGEPQSPPCGSSEPKVPQRPLPGYSKAAVIDTLMLGYEPIGIQSGKCGPERQKFLCASCRQKRWIIDSEPGCASGLTRYTVCSFCDVRSQTKREVRKLEASLLSELKKLRLSVDGRLSSFEERMARWEEKGGQEVGELRTPPRIRDDFEVLRTQCLGEISRLESRILVAAPEPVRSKESEVVEMAGQPPAQGTVSPTSEDVEYISRMYRQVVVNDGAMEVRLEHGSPPVVARPSEVSVQAVPEATSRRRRRRRGRRRRRRGGGENQENRRSLTLLLGDSLVGGATADGFSKLSPSNKCRALPGAGLWRITREVRSLSTAPANTLVLSVGGNDFFGRRGTTGDVKAIVRDYSTLLEVVKEKTSNCVVVGLVPRRFRSLPDLQKARLLNSRLQELCKARKMRFVDPWTRFFDRNDLFRKDGIHFSNRGADAFVEMVQENLRSPARRKKASGPDPAARRKPEQRKPDERPRRDVVASERPTYASVATRTEVSSPVVHSQKRQRSPGTESPSQKRRRASEGGVPDPGSPPLRGLVPCGSPPPPSASGSVSPPPQGSPPPPGNERPPE